MLAVYGHPFSSYTWKVLIALYANETPFELRIVSPDNPENGAFVAAHSGPLAKFPLLVDGGAILFESSTIIEHLAVHHPGGAPLLPAQPDAAIRVRMLDRLFDNYVMAPMTAVVEEHLPPKIMPDPNRIAAAGEKLDQSYRWLEGWLEHHPVSPQITLVECAAGPALHYANLVRPIPASYPRLRHWLEYLKALPPVRRVLEEAAVYQHLFPVPAAARD